MLHPSTGWVLVPRLLCTIQTPYCSSDATEVAVEVVMVDVAQTFRICTVYSLQHGDRILFGGSSIACGSASRRLELLYDIEENPLNEGVLIHVTVFTVLRHFDRESFKLELQEIYRPECSALFRGDCHCVGTGQIRVVDDADHSGALLPLALLLSVCGPCVPSRILNICSDRSGSGSKTSRWTRKTHHCALTRRWVRFGSGSGQLKTWSQIMKECIERGRCPGDPRT